MHPVARNFVWDVARTCFRISLATGIWGFHWFGNHVLFLFTHHRLPNRENPQYADLAFFSKVDKENIALGPYVDKELVKHFVRGAAPEVRVPDTFAVLNSGDELVGFELPQPYVAKPTHGSGVVVLKPEGGPLSEQEVRKLQAGLDKNYYLAGGEIQYRHLDQKILVEEFLGQPPDVPPDYKFQFANGVFQHCYVCEDRHAEPKSIFLDEGGEPISLRYFSPLVAFAGDFHRGEFEPAASYAQMMEIAEKLSRSFRFCRVDLFPLDDATYFGELTFSPGNVLYHYEPKEFMAIRP